MASKKVKISANQALNATNKVLNSMTEISDHYVNGKKYYNSNQAKADLMVVQKLRKRTDFCRRTYGCFMVGAYNRNHRVMRYWK